ncbi:chain length determinant protein EpsF [Noviherbaspirillum aridicola]|uniref:Polysaccharide chain length determinant N-terminal domain-containing protein n=1 Tax=Noviherbaspirillum aridicola TaxID=2849687 RepID=A0ABQ4Q719_9BURK|nr:chain length determinant protein EpsF [Noviherbaspirillum aridicola]GIZ52504.1 hypothetical protein NCCP691_25180 [Noviherbaspirillum aridicola]
MNFEQLFLIVKARMKTIVITLLCTVITTIVVSLLLPKTYTASTLLVLNHKGVDAVTGQTQPSLLMPGYVATQVDIINSLNVALRVVDRLKLTESPAVREDFMKDTGGAGDIRVWLAGLLQKRLEVVPSRESTVIEITFKNQSPEFAALVANAFAAEYQQTALQLKVEPLRRASTFFNEQIKTLRENLEAAQGKLSKYQQENGLVSVDNRLDVESARLNDLSTQLVVVQGQLAEAMSRQRQVKNGRADESPDVVANPLIQNLKASLAQAEAKFSEVSSKLGVNHPQYLAAKAELDKLRGELAQHIRLTSSSVASSAAILQQREAEVRANLQAQKTRVLELNRARDELNVLSKEVESAQRAYETSVARFNQTSMEGQANQPDVAVLTPALPPMEPTSPKLVLNVVLSIFFGTLLGLGLGMLAEFVDRRVRSESDLVQAAGAPMFGVIADAAAVAPSRRWFFKRGGAPRLA